MCYNIADVTSVDWLGKLITIETESVTQVEISFFFVAQITAVDS